MGLKYLVALHLQVSGFGGDSGLRGLDLEFAGTGGQGLRLKAELKNKAGR